MKKLIVVVMALITIFSASVSVYAASGTQVFIDWQIVDTLLNLQYNSTNCTIVKHYTSTPTPSMSNSSGVTMTQKTTYSALLSLYETVTVDGASFLDNALVYGQFEWYKYGNYCWIKYVTDNTENTCWVANRQGKILYCDAPTTSSSYTISAIAGATGYCLTTRPAGTSDSGYAGDMRVTQDSLTNIFNGVDGLGGTPDYFMVLRIIDGEYRYYIMCTYPNRSQYFVCNTSGRLYYALKSEPTTGGSGDGSTFDDSEIIAALNSVYDALDYGFYDVCDWLDAIQDNITSFNKDVQVLSQNVTSGFVDLKDIGTDIFTKLVGIETLLDVRLTSIKDDLWYIHGATAGLNSHFYDFAQVWEYRSETLKELINGVEPNLISISSNIQTYLPRLDSSVDEVESKLTSLESTMTSQHETIVDYWDMFQQGITSWGDMELYALYGFSPLGNEYPDSYLKKISDSFATWFGTGDAFYEGIYYQILYGLSGGLGYYDVYDQFHPYGELIYNSVDGLETTLSNIYDRLEDIEDAVVSADNVIIDITTDNDAFNIFYITKTDGTTESVGDAAKDAAKVVGEFLSIFYRLVFDDALSNADIIHDFEEVYTVNDSGVSVW